MQTIEFQTCLDRYKSYHFPENLQRVPRKGELVSVKDELVSSFISKRLPTMLEVVSVIYTEARVICELHYRKLDLEIAAQNKTNLF